MRSSGSVVSDHPIDLDGIECAFLCGQRVKRRMGAALEAANRVVALFSTAYFEEIRRSAAGISDPLLRSLDAIHLATALELGAELQAFVPYDRRLLTAATSVGLTVACPAPAPN